MPAPSIALGASRRTKRARHIYASHVLQHHARRLSIDAEVVKLKLSGYAAEGASSRDRPRDHAQDGISGTGKLHPGLGLKSQPGPGIVARRETRGPKPSRIALHRQRTSAVAHIGEKRTYGIVDLQHRSDIELHVFGVRQKGLVTGSDVADL
jgi:hypothetical protein